MKNTKKIIYIILFVNCYLKAQTQINKEFNLKYKPLFQNKNIQNIKINGVEKSIKTEIGVTTIENINLDYLNNKIYSNINGTGIIYEIDSNNHISRIDSTKYNGNNFGSTFFVYKNKIYNAGGYGFWSLTGSIRYFDTVTSEWSVLKTNKNIPFSNGVNSISFVDKKQGLIYILYTEYEPEYVYERNKSRFVKFQCYNLNSKKWFDNYFYLDQPQIKNISDIKLIHYTKNGILLNISGLKDAYELNFNNKTFYKINSEIISQIFQIKEQLKNYISYNIEDTLFFYNTDYNYSKYIVFEDNFKKIDNKIKFKESINENKSNQTQRISIVIISILTILIFLLIKEIRKIKSDKINTKNNGFEENLNLEDTLTNNEQEILKLLLKNNDCGKMTTVDEINLVLGLKNKNYKIQNNIRAEIINNINKKFKIIININDILIERKRTNFDKRFFEYYINKKYLSKVSKFFNF